MLFRKKQSFPLIRKNQRPLLFRKKQKRHPISQETELPTISTCSSRNYRLRPRNFGN